MTAAFQAPIALPSRSNSPPNDRQLRSRSCVPRATATMPSVASPAVNMQVLNDYEQYLKTRAPTSDPEAPVFLTSNGKLVCEYSTEIALDMQKKKKRMGVGSLLQIADYEAFLASEEGRHVDIKKPVYINDEGRLVCHLP